MKYYIQDFCCICLNILNTKYSNQGSNNSSKYTDDNLSPFDKIKTVFLGLSSVMENENCICLKCSKNIDSIYEFHKTCLKNIKMLSSYKKLLKENKMKKKYDLFVNLNALKLKLNPNHPFEGNVPLAKKIKSEPAEHFLDHVDTLYDNFVSESFHSSEVVIAKVKEEIDLEVNCEKCDEVSKHEPEPEFESFWVNPEIKIEKEEIETENELMNGINEVSDDDNSFQANINGYENTSSQSIEEVFIKEEEEEEEENQKLVKIEIFEKKAHNPSNFRFILPKPIQTANKNEQFNCLECGKTLDSKSNLDNHMIIHLKGRTQTEEEQVSHKKSNNNNSPKHTVKKSHKCDVCQKSFKDQSTLRRHKLTHTGIKPHKCNLCQKSFAQSGTLKTHMLLVHTVEKSRPYGCVVCSKSFNRKQHLNVHMLIHTGERPHICKFCGIGFHQKGSLKTHMLIHTGEKPNRCEGCGKVFNQKVNLMTHVKVHHGDRPQMM